eukprot:6471227-Amphidinium_carterae.1
MGGQSRHDYQSHGANANGGKGEKGGPRTSQNSNNRANHQADLAKRILLPLTPLCCSPFLFSVGQTCSAGCMLWGSLEGRAGNRSSRDRRIPEPS